MNNEEYLNSIVGELMQDPDWELPPQLRFMLVANMEWTLLGL